MLQMWYTHGSYLQGMETAHSSFYTIRLRCTDPTYKEWKQNQMHTLLRHRASTDPTYKEWKPPALCVFSFW